MGADKDAVRRFWDAAACGEKLLLPGLNTAGFRAQAEIRYQLEPEILEFIGLDQIRQGEEILEIGLGLGADHELLARTQGRLHGIDLTPHSVELTRRRLESMGLISDLRVADAESLPFEDAFFDFVYSWGFIHHTPDTDRAAREILRVLKPGGRFRVMVYHKWSLVGAMLWLRYALARGRPFMSLARIYATRLESPGTKAFTRQEAKKLFQGATGLDVQVLLTHGDLLASGAGQRHEGFALNLARRLWPRWLLRCAAKPFGLFLLISGTKPLP